MPAAVSRPVKASAAISAYEIFTRLVGVLGKHTNKRGSSESPVDAIEDVAFDFAAVFACDGHIAAILERFFQRGAKFGFGGEFGHPAFDALPRGSRRNFELFGIKRCVCSGLARRLDAVAWRRNELERSRARLFHRGVGRADLHQRIKRMHRLHRLVEHLQRVGIFVIAREKST